MIEDQEIEDFYEDFGAQPLSASELDAVLERARLASDRELRLLVKEVQSLRRLLPVLLERVEKGEGAADESEDEFLKLARFIIRGEGAIGGA
jgi:hypothetical protein